MSDYIRRSAALEWFAAYLHDDPDKPIPPDVIIEDIHSLFGVDAVEVVRCKDCKHYQCAISSLLGEVMCCTRQGNMNVMKAEHDFCSWGERKEKWKKL